MSLFKSITAFALLASVAYTQSSHAAIVDESMVFKAMKDEMQRNISTLRLGDLPSPYHVTYTLTFRKRVGTHSFLGSTQDIDSGMTASVNVAVRVGNEKFDNTNFFDVSLGFFGSSDDEEGFKNRRIPFEVNYDNLRRELWLATDACYKQAVEIYAKKESNQKNRTKTDTTWDFTLLPATTVVDTVLKPVTVDIQRYVEMVNRIASAFKNVPQVHSARVGFEYVPEESFMMTSEGRTMHKFESFSGIEMIAIGQASDGMMVAETHASYGIAPTNLESAIVLEKSANDMATSIAQLVVAPTIEAYSGPVLFEEQAAAELIAQAFAPNLVAQRQPQSDAGFSSNDRTLAFQNKIGARVLPEWLSVKATPRATTIAGKHVAGSYTTDDDGIASEEVQLVTKGYLKTLLSSRIPTKKIKTSNGHQRGGAPMISVTELYCEDKARSLDPVAMKKKLMSLVKQRDLPYGIIIKKALDANLLFTGVYALAGGDFPIPQGDGKMGLLEVWKVYPDGKEERIRGVEAAGLAPMIFKDIVAVGKAPFVHNYLAPAVAPSFMTGGSAYTISTIATPSLLLEDVELRPLEGDMPKPPYLSRPLN